MLQARVRVIELRNDLKDIMEEISLALQGIYRPDPFPPVSVPITADTQIETGQPFARVNSVAPGSPAEQAVRISGLIFPCSSTN